MNKENQKKYQAYKKAIKKSNKLFEAREKAIAAQVAVVNARIAAIEKLEKQWAPKLIKADKKTENLTQALNAMNDHTKAVRQGFLSKDNPDRAELFKLILD